MKRKAFGMLAIFLVFFQMFSPWMLTVSNGGLRVEKNIAHAATTRDKVAATNSDAFIIVTGFDDTNHTISFSTFTDPRYRINSIDKIEFIRDEFNDIENGCPTGSNFTLLSNPNLTGSNIKNSSFAGLGLTNTEARGYLKQDFTFTVASNTFVKDCVDDTSGSDAWGHYKFTYQTENTGGNKATRTEETATKQSVEDIADEIEADDIVISYITTVADTGNNFKVEWGRIAEKNFINLSAPGDLVIKGKSSKTISADANKTNRTDLKITFFQDNKERTLHKLSMSDTIDTAAFPPKADGAFDLSTEWGHGPGFTSGPAQMSMDPKKETGTKVTWIYLNSNIKQNIKIVFNNADYVMEDYSIKSLTPALKIDKPVLDVDISMLIDTAESREFIKWEDVDGDKKASAADRPGDDWDNFTADFGKPDIDKRSAKEGNGFYLLYSDTNQKPEVGDSDVKEVNLNPYIFGEKITSPIITDSKTGMVFGIDSIPVEKNKTYYLRLFARDNDKGFSDYGYTSVTSVTIPATITQQARGAKFIEAGNEAGEENRPDFLPACGADPTTWFQGCLIVTFYYLIFVPTSYLMAAAGTVLDFVLGYSIQSSAYKAQYIVDGWRFIRDVCNLFFILMLIFLAFKMILNVGHGVKQSIVNTLIIATVINFSYPLTTVIVDASNITARQLYYNAFNKQDDDGKPLSLSSAAAEGYNPQKIILEGTEGAKNGVEENKGTVFMILLVGVIFNIIAMVMFIKIALQFIYRIIGLIFAIILSPLAVFSFSLSGEQRSKLKMVGFEAWMSGLLQDAFKAPVFLFLIMILLLFVNNNPFNAAFSPDVNGLEWWASIIVPFMLIFGFFKVISSITVSMTSSLAQMAGESIVKGVSSVAGFGLGAVSGGASMLGRGTLGKWATGQAEKLRNSGKADTWYNRAKLAALDRTAKSSFDVRQTAAGNYFSKETGINMDNKLLNGNIPFSDRKLALGAAATAGGYLAQQDRKRARAIERGKFWGHNKKLEEELNHKKEDLEGEVKGMEGEKEGVKNEMKELNNGLKRYTEALDKKEREIDKEFDTKDKENNVEISKSDQTIAALTAQFAAAKTQQEKDNINNTLKQEQSNRQSLVGIRDTLKSERAQQKIQAKAIVEQDTKVNKDDHKAKIKALEDREGELNKKITDKKLGEEKMVPDLDSHGHEQKDANGNVIMKKIRVGGISGIEQGINKVKNDRMLKATLDYKRNKKTGDKIETLTYKQHYEKTYGADADKKGQDHFGKENWEAMKKVTRNGYVGKTGHMHEVTHTVDNHFHPENYTNNYRSPSGGGSKPAGDSHAAHPPAGDGHGH